MLHVSVHSCAFLKIWERSGLTAHLPKSQKTAHLCAAILNRQIYPAKRCTFRLPFTDPIDDAILEALTHDVRLLTVAQIARHLWCGKVVLGAATPTRLTQLERSGLIEINELIARPELKLRDPQIQWHPADRTMPRFGAASYQLKQRWTQLPVPTLIVRATRIANRLYGGYTPCWRTRPDEVTHDIHVGAVWMNYQRQQSPNISWIGEGKLRTERTDQFCGRIPDGLLRAPGTQQPQLIVEFGGAYATGKLREMHQAFASYPYVVW